MAGLKKKKKESSGSPNIVLVIFLVFFIILNITLGVWLYYAIEESTDARKKQKDAVEALNPWKDKASYNQMLYRDLRLAVGDEVPEDQKMELKNYREPFAKSTEKDADAARKLMEDLKKDLGFSNEFYEKNYKQQLEAAQAKIKELDARANTAITDKERAEALSKKLLDNQTAFHKSASERITKTANEALAEAQKRSDSFSKLSDSNRDLLLKLTEKNDEITKLKDEHDEKVRFLDRRIKTLDNDLKVAAQAGGGAGGGGNLPINGGGKVGAEPFPLILDITPGKPLWDNPVAKIIRVDLELRQVAINVGSSHGVRPELTFNVFGANNAGRAEKQMKGTIEVIKVIDASTSLCRITTLYDAEGREILLNVDTRTRLQRETEAPIREGDLLFNLFWGSRVAVVGYVSLTGEPSDSPADQIRQMDDFMHLMRRNGIQVDAYVDMRDGQIRGNISSKTRYVIKGDDLRAALLDKVGGGAIPAKELDKEKDKDKEPAKEQDKEPAKEQDKEPAVNADRNEQINKSSALLRKDAIERGLILISAENFANVIGYRKARNANTVEASNFRPGLPFAGASDAGVLRLPNGDRPKQEEKKDEKMEK
jgi:hypothetical protein